MHSRMTTYLDKFKIFYDYQFGFRKKYSTSTAVIDVVNMLQKELHEGNFVMGVCMDLKKAFDTVNFNILLDKLEYYGFRGTCLNWFKSYLIGRTQFTVANECLSNVKHTTCGIPQGTVLYPLLFLLYINDIANSVSSFHVKLFADDFNLFVVSDNILSLFDVANNELNNLAHWICVNKLYVNYDKTNYMIFVPRTRNCHTSNIIINRNLLFNGHIIKQVHCVKCLGVNIDDELNWSEHINFLVGKVSSMIGIMYRNKRYLPINCKKNIYFALIYSNLIYCIEVYANTNKSLFKTVDYYM
jgi:hypothetical protein